MTGTSPLDGATVYFMPDQMRDAPRRFLGVPDARDRRRERAPGVTHAPVALMALFMFAHGFWITNYITSIADVFGNRGTATVVGLSGTAGTLSSLLINPMIGFIVANYSYSPMWVVAGFLYPLAFILFIIFIPKIKLLPMAE